MKLYIRGHKIELKNAKITQTKQANDLSSLNTRQANYTNRFKAPLTAANIKAFGLLGIVGNTSAIPYEKNEAYLYADSGECFVYNGFAVIKSTGKDYDINIYDGNIDLYKSITNVDLSSLDLSEINHTKTVDTVVNSFTDNLDYKYILADYNGKATYNTDIINVDYLVPSVKVSYLWDKIFSTYGFTYSGSIFNTIDFQNLFMSYPKGVLSTIPDVKLYDSDNMIFPFNGSLDLIVNTRKSIYLNRVTDDINTLQQVQNDEHFKIFDAGNYRIQVEGMIKPRTKRVHDTSVLGLHYDILPCACELWLAKNSEGIIDSDNVTLITMLKDNIGSFYDANFADLSTNKIVPLLQDESLCLVLKVKEENSTTNNLVYVLPESEDSITFTISRVESEIIDFESALIGFKIKDFFNEILFRYGLTPYKDKYTNNYNFLTMSELLQGTNIDDWSAANNKFSELISESYLYGSYAQQNNFVHKYNDKEASYFDGVISVNNVNLRDSKTAIASKIYAPESETSNNLPKTTNIYKLWDKEIKEDGTIKYKPLKKRFYFLRSNDYTFNGSQQIGSEQLTDVQDIGFAPFESFFGLSFNDAIQDYYEPIYNILDTSKVMSAKVFLNEREVSDVDFTRLKYIKELGGYFILNKISNFYKRGLTKVELISVDYVNSLRIGNDEIITQITVFFKELGINKVVIAYNSSVFIDANIEYVLNGGVPVSVPNVGAVFLDLPISTPPQSYSIYLQDSGNHSETKNFNS